MVELESCLLTGLKKKGKKKGEEGEYTNWRLGHKATICYSH